MRITVFRGITISGIAVLSAAVFSPVVSAQTTQVSSTSNVTHLYQTNLTQQNKSGASGTATITLKGTDVTIAVQATKLSANLIHPMHIHIGGQATCPSPAADTDKDGLINSHEAAPAVGDAKISLTTSGDATGSSALALDRFPKADGKGALTYSRTISLPAGVTAESLANAVIDIHGVSSLFDNKTTYDGSKKSDRDAKLSFESVALAACGKFTTVPMGGAATGVGSISGIESPALFAIGAVALAGAVAVGIFARKQLTNRE